MKITLLAVTILLFNSCNTVTNKAFVINQQRQNIKKMVLCRCVYEELAIDTLGKKDASLSEYLQETFYKSPNTFRDIYEQSKIWRYSNSFFSFLQYEGYNICLKKCIVLYESKYLDSLVRRYDFDIDLYQIRYKNK